MVEKTQQSVYQKKADIVAKIALEEFSGNPFSLHLFIFIKAAGLAVEQDGLSGDDERWIVAQYDKYVLKSRDLQ